MTYLEGYLRTMVRLRSQHGGVPPGHYAGLEDFLLAQGKLYPSRPLTDREQTLVAAARYKQKFPMKQCYANSQKVVLGAAGDEFRYAEGYVMLESLPIPIQHAWLDLNGAVVDLTLRKQGKGSELRSLGTTPGAAYWGATFPTSDVRKFVLSTQYYGSLIDDWKNGWPYMRIGYRP